MIPIRVKKFFGIGAEFSRPVQVTSSRSPQEMETVLWALEQRVMMDAAAMDVELVVDQEIDLDDLSQSADVSQTDLPSNLATDLQQLQSFLENEDQAFSTLVDSENEEYKLELVVVDSSVNDHQLLVSQIIQQSAPGTYYDFIYVDGQTSGINAVTERLTAHQYHSLHLISHGSDGNLVIGNDQLNADNLDDYSPQFEIWQSALNEHADFFVYGCNLAESESGEAFVDALAEATGMDVAASDDLTGHVSLGGDWDLEYQVGDVDQDQLFDDATPDDFVDVLAVAAVGVDVTTSGEGGTASQSIAVDDAGNQIVVWSDTDADQQGVFFELRSADGTTVSPPMQVNTFTTGDQYWASVAADSSGNFAVTWTSEGQVSGQSHVFVRLFDSTGTALTGEIQVSDSTLAGYWGEDSSIAMDGAGNFIVSWEGEGVGDDRGVHGQKFFANGSKDGSIFLVNTTTAGTQKDPVVAMNDTGSFAIAYHDNDTDDIIIRRYVGAVAQAEDVISSGGDIFKKPAISMNSNGDFAVSWTAAGANEDVRAQVFDINGNPLTGVVTVNQGGADGDQTHSSIVLDDAGNFTVAYEGVGPGDADGVFMRKFDSAGNPLSSIILLNDDHTAGVQKSIAIAQVSDGRLAVTYSGEGASASPEVIVKKIVNATIFDQFNSANYSGNDGTRNWSNDWQEINDTGQGNTGDVRTWDELVVGDYGLRLRNDGKGAWREADLSNALSAMLTVDWALVSVEAGESAVLEISSDGGLVWDLLDTFSGPGDHSSLQTSSYDIINWAASNTRIRFVTTGMGGGDAFFTDNIRIDVTEFESDQKPTAVADNYSVNEDTSLAANVLDNDFDPNADAITAVLDDGPTNAKSFTLNPDGSFSYTANDNFSGVDSFTYHANDGTNDSDKVAVNITVDPVNDAPTATIVPSAYGINEDDPYRPFGGISVADMDAGSNDLTVTVSVNDGVVLLGSTTGLTFDAGTNDSASFTISGTNADINNALATLSYKPDLNFNGTDTLTLSVDDQGNTGSGGALTDVDTAIIIVSSINDKPVIGNQTFNVDENSSNGTVVGTVVASDPDTGDVLTYTITGGTGVGIFDIDILSGEIAVTDFTALDFEITPSLSLDVEVADLLGSTETATITINLIDLGEFSITGGVFEDLDGDADILDDNLAVDGVVVDLYRDINDNNLLDAGDQFVGQTVSVGGQYTFAGLTDDDYFVVVDSKTIAPSQGFNAGSGQGDVWAQQTYGSTGSMFFDGLTDTYTSVDGALYGGRNAGLSDDASDIGVAQHVTKVAVAGANATGVDYGFSFNVVTNTLAGDGQDDDAAQRTVQGSLRQFIQNANAISGDNAMRFVPVTASNASVAADDWWRVVVTNALPALTDAGTTIDGTAYDATNPVAVLNTNAGQLGTGGTVGTQGNSLNQVERPELEIINDRSTNVVGTGLDIQASNTTIQHVGIHGFGNGGTSANIHVHGTAPAPISGIDINNNVIGSSIHALVNPALLEPSDPLGQQQNASSNIVIEETDGSISTNSINNNVVGFADDFGIEIKQSSDWLITNNEIVDNAQSNATADGIDIKLDSNNVTVDTNLITGHQGNGIDTWRAQGQITITNNTIDGNGLGGVEQSGIKMFGADNSITQNVISNTPGPGVIIVNDNSSGTAASGNLVSQNDFASIGSISIDLIEGSSGATNGTGDGHNVNDGGRDPSGGNDEIDHPVINTANFDSILTTVSGTAEPNSTIEFYRSTGDGQATTFLGMATTNGLGQFSTTLAGLSGGEMITASVTDGANNTSEFGDAVTVNEIPVVSGATITTLMDTMVAVSLADLGYSDNDGQPLVSIDVQSFGSNGTWTLAGTPVNIGDTITLASITGGQLEFTPDTGDTGLSYGTLQFTAFDGIADSAASQISVDVTENCPLFSSPDTYNVNENVTSVGYINAIDPQATAVTYNLGGGVDDLQFSLNGVTGELSFKSPPNFESPSDFDGDNQYNVRVVATDADGDSTIQDVAINVGDVNEQPNSVVLSNNLVDEHANDGDSIGFATTIDEDIADAHTYVLVDDANGRFSIDPVTGELLVMDSNQLDFEVDAFHTIDVQTTDLGGNQWTETLTVNVGDSNDAPIAANDLITVLEGESVTTNFADLLLNDFDQDGDKLSVVLVKGPQNGTLSSGGPGAFVYQHDGSETTSDVMVYEIQDPSGAVDQATIVIDVTPQNDLPIAKGEKLIIDAEVPTVIKPTTLLVNDFDAEGDKLTIKIVKGPASGSVSINIDGDIVYTPPKEMVAFDLFRYLVDDGVGGSNVVTVLLNMPVPVVPADVEEPVDPPVKEDPVAAEPGEDPVGDPKIPFVGPNDPAEDDDKKEELGSQDLVSQPINTASTADDVSVSTVKNKFESNAGRDVEIMYVSKLAKGKQSLLDDLMDTVDKSAMVFVSSVSDIETIAFASMYDQLDSARQEVVSLPKFELGTAAAVAGVSGILTVGYVMWMTQSGMLVTGLVSSIPSWQMIDPLPILEREEGGPQNAADDDSLEDMVDNEFD